MHADLYSEKFIGSPVAIAEAIIANGFEVSEEIQEWNRYDKSIECKEPELHARNIKYGTVCDCQKISGTTVTHNIKIGDAKEIDELFEEFREAKKEMERVHARTNELLCNYQVKAYNRGWSPIRIDSNIYGWCFGSTLRSNIGGGRFSMTTRGLSMEQAVSQACQYIARGKNRVLTLSSSSLPKKTLELLDIPEPRTDDTHNYSLSKWKDKLGNK